MQVSVIYNSLTGHSKKIAYAISKALGISVYKVNENLHLIETDLLFVVGGIYAGQSNPKIVKFIETIEAKNIHHIALITSSASNKHNQKQLHNILANKKIIVIDEFHCLGSFLFVRFGHPNKQEINEAIKFAKNTIEKLNKPK